MLLSKEVCMAPFWQSLQRLLCLQAPDLALRQGEKKMHREAQGSQTEIIIDLIT